MSDDGTDYYLAERLQTYGPDAALAEVFVPVPARPAFRAMLVTWFELRDLLHAASEAELALARLGWWREEWARLADGEARHPLTRMLARQGSFASDALDGGLLGVARLLQMESCNAWDEVESAVGEIAASLGRIETGVASVDAGAAAATWHDIVSADLRLALPGLLRAGRRLLPLDLGAELQLSRSKVMDDPAAGRRLVGRLAGDWGPRASSPAPGGHAWIFRAILLRRLASRRSGGGEAGALGKLFAAWRGARQLRRQGA